LLHFVQNELEIFNQNVQQMERRKTSAFEASKELQLLKTTLENRKTLKFVPTEAREELKKLIDESSNCVQDLILKFYNCALEYLYLWEESFDGAPIFNWINLRSVPEWNEIKKAYDVAASKFGETFKES
jgi:hypothetical protein